MKPRSLFLSFLGTNTYTHCNYSLPGHGKVDGVRFVQEALVRLLCAEFRPPDRIVVFLTDEARQKNWFGEGQPGLETCLARTVKKGTLVQPVVIPEGKSPEELWRIFETVFGVIQENDRVLFDITHGFRSLPMLGIVLLNYARLLKNITIAGIYYGAFEVLGPLWKVKELPLEKRNAPIFDLSDFATLLAWSSGVQEFVKHGSPDGIVELLWQEAEPRLKESRGQDAAGKIWKGVAHNLAKIGGQVAACRGRELVAGEAVIKLRSYLEQCKELSALPPPFVPLIKRITNKIEPFRENDAENCLRAVAWCLEHDLVQQGLTMLQEGLITLIAARHGLEWRVEADRTLISESISVKNQKTPEAEWKGEVGRRPDLAHQIQNDPFVAAVAGDFDMLSKARNDINHGGFTEAVDAEQLRKKLRKAYEAISAEWTRHRGTGPYAAGPENPTQEQQFPDHA
ncbi:MAG TPA: TIGR02221 family CRISPR-associated protein [Desulfobacteraceae bacterium]|nr:TIGR02221 family CRISPR-associated protein [Desulfobacteraceae bacterium]